MKYDANGALLESAIDGLPEPIRGKVRDIYVFDDCLMLVASDRLSAFDVVMPNGIPDKGKVLTFLSKFWFEKFDWIANHLISMDISDYPEVTHPYAQDLEGRSMLVRKLEPLPVEAVARGYLIGSGWKDYQRTGSVCGISLRDGHSLAGKLDDPLYTPAYKAPKGEHDENITYARTIELIGAEAAATVRELTLKLYSEAAAFAHTKGIIIADNKFEFGRAGIDFYRPCLDIYGKGLHIFISNVIGPISGGCFSTFACALFLDFKIIINALLLCPWTNERRIH